MSLRDCTPHKPLFSRNRWSAKPGLGRCYLRLCSSPLLLRSSLDEVKMLLSKNGYPSGVVNYNINDVLSRQQNKINQGIQQPWYPKNEIRFVLPYLGLQSKIITKRLQAFINKFYGCIDLRVIFHNTHRIKSLFPYKDRLNRSQMSKVVMIKLVVGTVKISTLAKPNGDCMTEKLNTSRQSSARHQSTFPHFQS